jgi:putative endonuclease
MKLNKRSEGAKGEAMAVDYLEKKGYHILQRNYRFERGEIDIVAELGAILVFIEVKARSSHAFGRPEESVTERKQKQIKAVADGYIFEKEIGDRECRFDIIAITSNRFGVKIKHLEGAF